MAWASRLSCFAAPPAATDAQNGRALGASHGTNDRLTSALTTPVTFRVHLLALRGRKTQEVRADEGPRDPTEPHAAPAAL